MGLAQWEVVRVRQELAPVRAAAWEAKAAQPTGYW
jgi:hypothetical protein